VCLLAAALLTVGVCPGALAYHSADTAPDWSISLSELLRVIQFFNTRSYSCVIAPEVSEDGFLPGNRGDQACAFHDSDYAPQDWSINLTELLRLIQFFNMRGYHEFAGTEDGFGPGPLVVEGETEGTPEGSIEGTAEGATEGSAEGSTEGAMEGEGASTEVLDGLADLRGQLDGALGAMLDPDQQAELGNALDQVEEDFLAGDPCGAAEDMELFLAAAQTFRGGRIVADCERLYNLGRRLRYALGREIASKEDCPALARVGVDAAAAMDEGLSGITGFAANVDFGEPKVLTKERGGDVYTWIEVPGGDADLIEPGAPGVPVFRRLFAAPLGAELHVEFSTEPAETIQMNLHPAQLQPVDAIVDPTDPQVFADPPFVRNSELYETDRAYPPNPVNVARMGEHRGLNIYSVEVAAGQYNPVSQTLTLFEKAAVNVTFVGGEGVFISEAALKPSENKDSLAGVVLNGPLIFDHVKPYPVMFNMGEELMILTHRDFLAAAQRLADWKNRKGIVTQVFAVNNGAELGPDTNEEIAAFIRNEFDTSQIRPSYVLLLGDADYIPTFYLSAMDPGGVGSATIGTDWPYANYSNWALDFVPDFGVGRITVDTLVEANAVVDKLIHYESTPPNNLNFYRNASIASQFQCCNQNVSQVGVDQRTFIWVSEWCRDVMTNNGKVVERIYRETVDGGCATCDPPRPAYTDDATPRRYHNGDALPGAIGPSTAFGWNGSTNNILQAFDAGRFLIIHRDHGSPGAWETPWLRWSNIYGDGLGGNDPKIANGDLLPVVFSVNCASGLFDGETGGGALGTGGNFDYLVERMIKMPDGGAIGVFGDTRNSPSTPNSVLLMGFFDAMWPQAITTFGGNVPMRRMGDILNHGKMYLLSQLNLIDHVNASTVIDEIHMWHVFGDPTLEIWTAYPYDITLPSVAQGTWLGNTLRVQYAMNNVTVTATQTNVIGGVTAFGRGVVQGGVVDLPMAGTPSANKDTHLAFNRDNAISREAIIKDAVPPANVSDFTAEAHKEIIMLNWTNPATDFNGVRIQRKTGGYPTSPTDGTNVYNGSGNSYFNTPPALATKYYYTAFAYDHTPNYASGVQASATTWSDVTGPGNVTSFTAVAVGPGLIQLDWDNPTDADFNAVKVIRKEGACPFSETDGVQVYNGSGTSFTDSGLDNGVTYYYGAYAYDAWPNYASGVCRNATTPADVEAPGDVSEFGATPADVCPTLFLSWENPADEDFAGVKILRKTTGYSFSPTDGTVIYNGPGTNVVDNIDLTENTPYYYTIYAYDGTPNYSLGVRATVTSGDCVAVQDVLDFTATPGDAEITLTWTNPADLAFAGVRIQRKVGSYPSSVSDGTKVYEGADQMFVNHPVENNITYYYKAYSYNSLPLYSNGVEATATPHAK
jgi:hypothetical protein